MLIRTRKSTVALAYRALHQCNLAMCAAVTGSFAGLLLAAVAEGNWPSAN